MKQYERQLRRTIFVALFLFVGSMLVVTAYTLWRLRTEAVASGLEISAMYSRGFEDWLTQSLHLTELVAANTLAQAPGVSDPAHLASTFVATLNRAPFLRSMSLLDEGGHIVASSNPANVGLTLSMENYLPPTSGAMEMLRIGPPWKGRDFSKGEPTRAQALVNTDDQGFIPVTQTLVVNERYVTVLFALNSDYFINHISQKLGVEDGFVEVLRYDGILLMSTDPVMPPGSLQSAVMHNLKLAEVEFGRFEREYRLDHKVLAAFRASHLYPFVVITNINREFALEHWKTEAKALLGVVIPVLLAIVLLALAFYRRQLQLTAHRVESQRLQQINATVFDSSAVAILITDLNANILSINSAYTRVTGYRPDEVIGHHLNELLTPEGVVTVSEKIFERQVTGANDEAEFETDAIEVQQRCKDGRLIWTEIHSTPERDAAGGITGYHRICRNITERKQMEDQVRQLAFYDPLTNLPNRRLLDDRLRQSMATSKRSGCYAALMFLDLDNFKPLNDSYGHGVGDLLLVEAANRLRNCVREMDTVARFGGDEFVVLLSVLNSDKGESTIQAGIVADKIRTVLSEPYRLVSGHAGMDGAAVEHFCTISVGVVVFIDHEASQDDILKWADAAMYYAKDAGRNTIRFYGQETVLCLD